MAQPPSDPDVVKVLRALTARAFSSEDAVVQIASRGPSFLKVVHQWLTRRPAKRAASGLFFQNPIFFNNLMEHAEMIEGSIHRLLPGNDSINPVIATLPHASLNGISFFVSKNGSRSYVIGINDGIHLFFAIATMVISKCLGIGIRDDQMVLPRGSEEIRRRVHQQPELSKVFTDLVSSYLLFGMPVPVASSQSESMTMGTRTEALFSSNVAASAIQFIVAHEYSHILNGDFVDHNELETGEEIHNSLNQEYAADGIGFQLVLDAHLSRNKDSLPPAYGGIDLFFTMMEILERGKNIFLYGTDRPIATFLSGHPPASDRRAQIRKTLPSIMTKAGVEVALAIANVVEEVVETLWTVTKPAIEQKLKQGERLHPMWVPRGEGFDHAVELNKLLTEKIKEINERKR